MDELIFAGNKYISSKRASKLTGYTTDYIGQICRADKMECRLVGRNWYIKESEIERNKKSFKKEHALGYSEQTRAIEYEKVGPELLYYSNDKHLLNPEISKIYTENTKEIVEENNEEDIPIRIIKKPEVSVERYALSPVQRQIVRRQPIVPQQTHRRSSVITVMALVLVLASVLFTAGTFTLEQVVHYSSENGANINTSFQLANVQETLKMIISFRQDS